MSAKVFSCVPQRKCQCHVLAARMGGVWAVEEACLGLDLSLCKCSKPPFACVSNLVVPERCACAYHKLPFMSKGLTTHPGFGEHMEKLSDAKLHHSHQRVTEPAWLGTRPQAVVLIRTFSFRRL